MSQSRANKPDTAADIELRRCLTNPRKRSFTMVAGAGSGKTTSLVKALATIVSLHGGTLRNLRQKVACITYTEIAAQEIWADVGSNPLVHVSTIHSFLWAITRTFQRDIRDWVQRRIGERIAELLAEAADFGSRVQQRTRDVNARKIQRLEESRAPALAADNFSYGTGSNYANGILGHDDIIRIATDFLRERPLFRTLLAQQYPFIFVDEGQDTQAVVIEALKAVDMHAGEKFCLGFFGDPMQRIFPTGGGDISGNEGWLQIAKPENFRCPTAVLAVANAIRRGGDDLVQVGGRFAVIDGHPVQVVGTAQIFVLPADNRRDEFVRRVGEFTAAKTGDEGWRSGPSFDVKMLVVVHRMAALRLKFGELYAAMNDRAPGKFSDGFLDGTSWPLRPFVNFILPVVSAANDEREFDVMVLLRKYSPQLQEDKIRERKLADVLSQLRAGVMRLGELMADGVESSVREILNLVHHQGLVSLEPRMLSYLEENGAPHDNVGGAADIVIAGAADDEDATQLSREISAMDAFLACPARQFFGYQTYVREESPFATQQGVKGAEYDRVMVILDDEEGTHRQFSYDKYFGVKAPSRDDLKRIAEGLETSVDRTRRLLYVCCTRALNDLAVIYFSDDPATAERQVRQSGIFADEMIFNENAL